MADRESPPHIEALTSIRFFFAAMVLFGHFVGHYPETFSNLPRFVFLMAPVAVSWFFVLSGFIIAHNYPTLLTQSDRATFIVARIARIWPVHFLTLICAVFIIGRGHLIWFVEHVTLTHAWLADGNVSQAYNGVSWSVSNEMFFYLVYIAIAVRKRWMVAPVIAVSAIACAALLFSHGCFSTARSADAPACVAYFAEFPPARLIEFLAGVALYRLRPQIPQMLGLITAGVMLGYVMPSIIGFELDVPRTLLREAAIILGGCALIAALARDGLSSRLLAFVPLVIGGEISYSIYMTHQLVMAVILPLVANWSISGQFLLVFSAIVVVSIALFFAVEKPARDAVKLRLSKHKETISRQLTA